MRGRVREIAARRSVLKLLITRDLKIKYEKSVLGYLWSVLEPLLLALVYWFIFGVIMNVQVDDYPVFVLAGLLPWLWASSTINMSTGALTTQARLVKTTSVPREIWVLRLVGAKWVEFLLSFPVLIAFAIIYHRTPNPSYLLLLPVVMVLQATLLTGIALFLASVSTMFNDMKNIVRIVMRLLFYFSPILYGFSRVARLPEAVQSVYALNPFVGILELNRAVWFPNELELGSASWLTVLVPSVTLSLAFLVLGWTVFARLERAVLKEL